jgi:hypothetical protein
MADEDVTELSNDTFIKYHWIRFVTDIEEVLAKSASTGAQK